MTAIKQQRLNTLSIKQLLSGGSVTQEVMRFTFLVCLERTDEEELGGQKNQRVGDVTVRPTLFD